MTPQVLSSEQQLRSSVVAINQTRSQVEEIFRDKKHHLQITSYKVYVLIRVVYQVISIQTVE